MGQCVVTSNSTQQQSMMDQQEITFSDSNPVAFSEQIPPVESSSSGLDRKPTATTADYAGFDSQKEHAEDEGHDTAPYSQVKQQQQRLSSSPVLRINGVDSFDDMGTATQSIIFYRSSSTVSSSSKRHVKHARHSSHDNRKRPPTLIVTEFQPSASMRSIEIEATLSCIVKQVEDHADQQGVLKKLCDEFLEKKQMEIPVALEFCAVVSELASLLFKWNFNELGKVYLEQLLELKQKASLEAIRRNIESIQNKQLK